MFNSNLILSVTKKDGSPLLLLGSRTLSLFVGVFVLLSTKCACRACGIFSGVPGDIFFVFMEDFYRSWGRLSLSEKEILGFVLPIIPKKNEFIIAENS